jgi:origin recognition complex subunit 4
MRRLAGSVAQPAICNKGHTTGRREQCSLDRVKRQREELGEWGAVDHLPTVLNLIRFALQLLDSVLRSVEKEGEEAAKTYHLVQLDGAIQSTDRLSMRELARQLVKKGAIKMPKEGEEGALDFRLDGDDEARVEEEDPPLDTVADVRGEEDGDEDEERKAVTNAVLVSRGEAQQKEVLHLTALSLSPFDQQSSLSNTTSTILTLLSTGSNSKKSLPLIITLASFDLYTSRPRQALLYVLLDAVQAGSYTPGLCVVGMTSRLDTNDLLEKRVRSRFGGRIINVWPENVWVNVMRRTLLLAVCQETTGEGKAFDEAWKKEVKTVCADKTVLDMLEDRRSISNVVQTLYKTLVCSTACCNVERVLWANEIVLPPSTPSSPLYLSDCRHYSQHSPTPTMLSTGSRLTTSCPT